MQTKIKRIVYITVVNKETGIVNIYDEERYIELDTKHMPTMQMVMEREKILKEINNENL